MKQLDLHGVFAVPPLARRNDQARSLDFEQNDKIVSFIEAGGISRLIYGGNAFLYHVTLSEFESLLEWLASLVERLSVIPSIGPSFGRAMDQARFIKNYTFPSVMVLPCADPRDAHGLEQGFREIAEAANSRLIIYLKDETNFGSDLERGLDAVARLIEDGICLGIKYAVVRKDPVVDPYLEALLSRVDRKYVISGIGERPAVTHMRDWQLPGFTTGSGCVIPGLSQKLYEACSDGDFESALKIRSNFMGLEDLRDSWGPARVLHHAVELAGIAEVGPIPPYLSSLADEQIRKLQQVVDEVAKG
jgi:dihydrodipicolinate synthase/N-acetylneuraminate lyase